VVYGKYGHIGRLYFQEEGEEVFVAREVDLIWVNYMRNGIMAIKSEALYNHKTGL